MASDFIRERSNAPPYVTPYLDALDRMLERTIVRPDQLADRCRKMLNERFGSKDATVETAFAHAATGLIGEHTHYFEGYGILMSLPLGTAVAARAVSGGPSQLAFEGGKDSWVFDTGGPSNSTEPTWVRLVEEIFHRLVPSETSVEVAVLSTVPSSCLDAYLVALGIAAARVARTMHQGTLSGIDSRRLVRDVIETCTGYPFSIAYLVAADTGHPGEYTLVDTHTLEHLDLEAPSREELGWGFVDVGMGALQDVSFHARRRELAAEAAEVLRRKGFPRLTSLRDLEHKDLKTALTVLPRKLKPVARHLVTENRRVQKLVAAVRRRDWQMFGALLLMSHSSHQKDWGSTNEIVDAVVNETEMMSIDGMYGANVTGRGGCVLTVGQPFIVPRCLDRIQIALEERLQTRPDVMLL